MTFVVAIDGPAAAGKGTMAKAVAAHFGFAHLDSGLLYRAVGLAVLDAGGDPGDPETAAAFARQLTPGDLTNPELRTAKAAKAASLVAAIPAVRDHLIDFQREFATNPQGAVIDGRDIGTVICPEAQVKLFVTASAEVRAHRRFEELTARGNPVTFEQVLQDVKARDTRDAQRDISPMRAAKDAILIDTSDLSIEEATAQALRIIETHR